MSDVEKNTIPIASSSSTDVKIIPSGAADEALNFLRAEDVSGSVVDLDEKALVRKIDWMVMPVDRSALYSFA
jgi:hypothetical protein